jgi:hypothetical protein
VEALYRPLIVWAIQQWENPSHTFHLALDTTMLWQTPEHPWFLISNLSPHWI